MKLYGFFASGSSHRLRIVLNLKGLQYEYAAVNLRAEEHGTPAYRAINPQGLVPALDIGGRVLTQSPAIIEWLEERYPDPLLLPRDREDRAYVRALAALVGCDIHPINNRRILQALRRDFAANEDQIQHWCDAWISAGFNALETFLAKDARRGNFCFGSGPTLADAYLIPQVFSARRFKVDMARWPLITKVDAACNELPAFQRAAPAAQPDVV